MTTDSRGTTEVPVERSQVVGRRTRIQEWIDSFRASPLFALALLLYMGLPSSVIFPGGSASLLSAWHLAYQGWYDWVYLTLTAGALALLRARVPSRTVLICLFFLLSIILSIVFNGTQPALATDALLDALAYWIRFSLTFVFTAALTERKGADATSQMLYAVGLLLMASSIFVFRLQYPEFNRIYASGMTVGSFGQVLLILFAIAMIRNHIGMMLISSVFLILTFSRTALLLWFAGLGYFLVTRSTISIRRRMLYGGLVVALVVAASVILLQYPEFQFVINERLDLDDIYSMNRRTEVWEYGIELISSKSVPVLGIGFNLSPSVLLDFTSVPTTDPSQLLYFPSFHSIVFEYVIGLGLLAIPIFAFFLWRIAKAWRLRSHLAFFLYSLFVLSQSIDFSFYRPKEVIIWAAFLGLAEGELGRQSKRRPGRLKVPSTTADTSVERRQEAAALSSSNEE